ncbi:MAG: hypothetical protein ACLFQA_03180 [Bacteroidales bacterium]
MDKFRLLILLVIVSVMAVSCDEEIFGPRSLEGTWKVSENSDAYGPQNFIVGIEYVSGDSSKIIIDNFSNLDMGVGVSANVSGLMITIPAQSVNARGGPFRVSGNGTANATMRRISWNYRIDDDNFTAIFEK